MAIGDERELQNDGGSEQQVHGVDDTDAVYAPPKSDLREEPDSDESFKIYAPSGIALAGFLGGPLGVTYLYATNYSRAGKTLARNLTVVAGLLSSVIVGLMVLGVQQGGALPGPIVMAFVAYGLAKGQNRGIKKEFQFQFSYVSDWQAAVVGVISLAITVVIAAAVVLIVGFPSPVS